MNKHNSNGYKVCYKEKNSKHYVRYFLTYTYKHAKFVMASYLLYPPKDRQDNHILVEPVWKIIPIKNKEIKDGIWREIPF